MQILQSGNSARHTTRRRAPERRWFSSTSCLHRRPQVLSLPALCLRPVRRRHRRLLLALCHPYRRLRLAATPRRLPVLHFSHRARRPHCLRRPRPCTRSWRSSCATPSAQRARELSWAEGFCRRRPQPRRHAPQSRRFSLTVSTIRPQHS